MTKRTFLLIFVGALLIICLAGCSGPEKCTKGDIRTITNPEQVINAGSGTFWISHVMGWSRDVYYDPTTEEFPLYAGNTFKYLSEESEMGVLFYEVQNLENGIRTWVIAHQGCEFSR